MIEKYNDSKIPAQNDISFGIDKFWKDYDTNFKSYEFDKIVEEINGLVGRLDKTISDEKPWEKQRLEKTFPIYFIN